MKAFSLILLAGIIMLLLGCGSSGSREEVQGGDGIEPLVASGTPSSTVPAVDLGTPSGIATPAVETKTPIGTATPPVETKTPASTVAPTAETKTPKATPAPLNASATLPMTVPPRLEERIFASPVIARVRLDSVSSWRAQPTYQGMKVS